MRFSIRRSACSALALCRARSGLLLGGAILLAMLLAALLAPHLGTRDPRAIAPYHRLAAPSAEAWFGTDRVGRDIYSRVVYGTRISLTVGAAVVLLATAAGALLGMVAGLLRPLDNPIMRLIDGLTSIPAVLLAIGLMALTRPGLANIVLVIAVGEVPGVARLVRSVVLSLREQTYIQAAIVIGTRAPQLLWRHILPNLWAVLTVQATYVFASAMIFEAILSFIGAGAPPEQPSWGNLIAEGHAVFQTAPHLVLFPAAFLSLLVLGVNLLGNGLRELLDARAPLRL